MELTRNERDEITLLTNFAQETIHKIELKNKQSSKFNATNFVYAMIAFNKIYDKTYIGKRHAWEKIVKASEIVFKKGESIDLFVEELEEIENYEKYGIIKDIWESGNIAKTNMSDPKKRTYLKAFLDSVEKIQLKEKLDKNDILMILLYLNQVRNNLFHGSKDTNHICENSQNARFEIYKNLIIAFNRVALKIIKEK